MIWISHNGKEYFAEKNAPIFSIQNTIRYGYGVFDTMLCKDHSLIYGAEHIDRLLDHAQKINLSIKYDQNTILKKIKIVLEQKKDTAEYHVINTYITAGNAARGLSIKNKKPYVIIKASSLEALPEKKPAKLCISDIARRNEYNLTSKIKSMNYLDNIIALENARSKSYDDAILLNTKRNITCTTTANIFILKGEKLTTPPISDGVMDGIIRQKVINKYKAIEKSFTQSDLENADAVFLTNSVRGIIPVSQINKTFLKPQSLPVSNDIHLK